MAAKRTGIVGVPPLAIIQQLHARGNTIIDLDEPQTRSPLDPAAEYLPRVYCAILRTVVLNCLRVELDEIYIDVGPGKCDCALHVATILESMLDIAVIRTRNTDSRAWGTPLCRAEMSLLDKISAITLGVRSPMPAEPLAPCRPTAGFWGVPPRDFSILSLFPATTHVYGWTRCMENKTPADLELEMHVNQDIPTVFFAQSFCAKTALAHHLARRHPRALYVDADVTAGNSIRAKIEAFLELSGVFRRSAGEVP